MPLSIILPCLAATVCLGLAALCCVVAIVGFSEETAEVFELEYGDDPANARTAAWIVLYGGFLHFALAMALLPR